MKAGTRDALLGRILGAEDATRNSNLALFTPKLQSVLRTAVAFSETCFIHRSLTNLSYIYTS